MRTIPHIKLKDNKREINEMRIQLITRKVAIVFILLVQLAIIFKMLL